MDFLPKINKNYQSKQIIDFCDRLQPARHIVPGLRALPLFSAAALAIALFCSALAASPAQAALIGQQQLQRQQEREKALRERIEPQVDSLHPQPRPAAQDLPAQEWPCFAVHGLELTGERHDELPWLKEAAGVDWSRRPCLGAKGVEVILARMQQALLERGYVTSRVLAAPQNLQSGILQIAFVPGVLREARLSPDSPGDTSIMTALPSRPGGLLQLRAIEQGLENLQRVPGADADIQIIAAEGPDVAPGQSDLLITYQQARPWRLHLAMDDGGTRATGKIQATATASWDNPLGLNDLMYFSAGHGIGNGGRRGTQTRTLHYSLPFGYWLGSLTGSRHKYHQNVAGAYEDYVYSGEASHLDFKLSRVIHRSAATRTTAAVHAFHRSTSSYIDDTEIDVQRRRTSGHAWSLSQRSYLGSAVVDGTLSFKRGTGAFGALPAPEALWGEGTARMKMRIADIALTGPFELAGHKLRFSTAWHRQ